jgi:hypothetical protein
MFNSPMGKPLLMIYVIMVMLSTDHCKNKQGAVSHDDYPPIVSDGNLARFVFLDRIFA